MSEFASMGGYAPYVWGSYAFTALVFAWNVIAPRLRHAEVLRRLKARQETEA